MKEREAEVIKEILNKVADAEEIVSDYCPDMEKLPYPIQSLEQLSEVLANRFVNLAVRMRDIGGLIRREWEDTEKKLLIEDIRGLQEQLDKAEAWNKKLINENEYHLKNVETLARQLEIYKCKSKTDIDKKLNLMETKAKQEATQLRLENKHLQEILIEKSDKIEEMTKEIERMINLSGELYPPASALQIEKKLKEMAEKGQLSFRIALPEGPTYGKKYQLNELLSLHRDELIKMVVESGRILDFIEPEYEKIIDRMRSQINSLTKERNEAVQAADNELIMLIEQIAAKNPSSVPQEIYFKALELKAGNAPMTQRKSERRDFELSRSPITPYRESVPSLLESADIPLPKELEHSAREAPLETLDQISKLFEEKHFSEGAEAWKLSEYEILPKGLSDTVSKLRIVCKLRDKQISLLQSQTQSKWEMQSSDKIVAIMSKEVEPKKTNVKF